MLDCYVSRPNNYESDPQTIVFKSVHRVQGLLTSEDPYIDGITFYLLFLFVSSPLFRLAELEPAHLTEIVLHVSPTFPYLTGAVMKALARSSVVLEH